MPEAAADLMFWVALVCCAVAQIAIIRSVFLVTPAAATGAAATGAERAAAPRRASELAWALLPAIVLAALFWVTWRAMHTHTVSNPGGIMRIS